MDDNVRLIKLKNYISKMPSLPTSVTKIMEICNNPQTSPADLNQVISLDPVLMGKVMKLINSAYYGLSQEITSLVRAIIMLGINTVKNLALSTAVLSTIGGAKDFSVINMNGFWRHSLCVGVTAKLIAKKRNVNSKLLEEYFITGLLHDIGKIPLNNKFADDYINTMSISDREKIPLYKAEKNAMGMDHTEVGAMISEAWKLGQALSETIIHHHNVENYHEEHKDILYTVALANYFSNSFEIGFSGNRYPEKLSDSVMSYLNINMNYLEEIEDTVNNEIEKAQVFLHLTAGSN